MVDSIAHTAATEETDEQMAQRLGREEEYEQRKIQEESDRQLAQALSAPPPGPSAPLPYQPYVPGRRRAPSVPQVEGENPRAPRDELDQLSDKFALLAEQGVIHGTRLAAVGKKTLGSIFDKIKAKVDEFEGSPPPNQSSSSSQPFDAAYVPPNALPNPAARTQFSASTPVKPTTADRPLPDSPALPTPPTIEKSAEKPSAAPVVAAVAPAAAVATLSTTPALAATPPIEELATEASKTDFSKIGLLPRQSVPLTRDKRDDSDGDDSDLEYVRSPFDDD